MSNPFHLAIQVRDLAISRHFYTQILGCEEGFASDDCADFNFFGHHLVCHENKELEINRRLYRAKDGHDIPTPHFGIILDMDHWQTLAERLERLGLQFIIEPKLRFRGQPGERATMFFLDPSGNALEIKAFEDIENKLFAHAKKA